MGIRNWFRRKAVPEHTPTVALVDRFVAEMETGISDAWCKCQWRIHPDDQGGKLGHCAICDISFSKHTTDRHAYRGIRRVRVDTHPHCPVHTKEGLILRFLEWSGNAR